MEEETHCKVTSWMPILYKRLLLLFSTYRRQNSISLTQLIFITNNQKIDCLEPTYLREKKIAHSCLILFINYVSPFSSFIYCCFPALYLKKNQSILMSIISVNNTHLFGLKGYHFLQKTFRVWNGEVTTKEIISQKCLETFTLDDIFPIKS